MKHKEFLDFVEEVLKRGQVPGAQVCLMDEGGIILSHTYGFADAEKKKPITEQTIFGIASMSKSLTCTAISLLEHEGKLSWQDPVKKFFPAFSIPGMPAEAVTLEHLAMHTTGIPPLPTLAWSFVQHTAPDPWEEEDYEILKKEAESKIATVDDIIHYIAHGNYQPLGQAGEYRSYLNEGYALLSSVVDQVANQPLETFLAERVFGPLKMTHTTFDLAEAKATGDITDLFASVKGEVKGSKIWDEAPPYRGCGWVKSTAEDMTRYYLCLSQAGILNHQQVIPSEVTERMFGARFETTIDGKYCYGLNKHTFNGHVICDHSGGLKGVASRGGFIKGESFAVTVLTNLGSFNTAAIFNAAINFKLDYALDTSQQWAKAANSTFFSPEVYTGKFRIREGKEQLIEITYSEDEGLMLHVEDQTLPMIHCGKTDFLVIPKEGKEIDAVVWRAYVRDGKAWGFSRGSRMLQRV